jgi:hypothetical protein
MARLLQSCDQPQDRRLAAAGRAQQRHQCTARYREADGVERRHRAKAFGDGTELHRWRRVVVAHTGAIARPGSSIVGVSARRPMRRSPTSNWIKISTSIMNTTSIAE